MTNFIFNQKYSLRIVNIMEKFNWWDAGKFEAAALIKALLKFYWLQVREHKESFKI